MFLTRLAVGIRISSKGKSAVSERINVVGSLVSFVSLRVQLSTLTEKCTNFARVVSSGRRNEIVVGGRIVYSSNP